MVLHFSKNQPISSIFILNLSYKEIALHFSLYKKREKTFYWCKTQKS